MWLFYFGLARKFVLKNLDFKLLSLSLTLNAIINYLKSFYLVVPLVIIHLFQVYSTIVLVRSRLSRKSLHHSKILLRSNTITFNESINFVISSIWSISVDLIDQFHSVFRCHLLSMINQMSDRTVYIEKERERERSSLGIS